MKKAGAIIRVSTSKQLEGTSPEKQIEAIQVLAADQGYKVGDENTWVLAESGNLRERTGFREVLQAADAGKLDRVYVFSVDRLGRNLLEMMIFLRDLEDLSIECWEAEKHRRLDWDDFMLQIEGAVAGKERREILKRTKDGIRRAIEAGKYSGGIIAYGYQLNTETKKLETNNEEAVAIRMIFDWCVDERLSCVKIAERLNAMEIPTRYKKDGRKIRKKGKRAAEHTAGIWRAGRVRNMLKNPAYMGEWEYGKRSKQRKPEDRITGSCPAIISSETFHRAAEVLHQNQLFSSRQAHRQYLLRGLIKCGVCGLTYCGITWKVGPKRSKEKVYYACNGRTQWRKLGKPRCLNRSVNGDALEAAVWEDIKSFILNPEVALEYLRAEHQPDVLMLRDLIANVQDQIIELQRRKQNLLKVAAESEEVDIEVLDDAFREIRRSLASLRAYESHLDDQCGRGEALEKELFGAVSRLSTLRKKINITSFTEKRGAVEELVKGIVIVPEIVKGKETAVVTITFRFDKPEQPPPPDFEYSTYIQDHTPVPVATSATRFASAPARQRRLPAIKRGSLVRCSIGSISTSKCREWISRS